MAKSAPAPKAEEPVPAVVAPSPLAMPDWAKEYSGPVGTENIDSGDVNIPRLKLAQSMTPEVKDRIVQDGDLFHSITKEVIIAVGSSGLVVPVVYQKEFILWRDRSDGGGIFARAHREVQNDGTVRYAWDKPNSVFTTKIKGAVKVEWKTKHYIDEDGLSEFGTMVPGDRESPPAATAHFNYVMYLPDRGDMVAVSFARSAAKRAKDLNAMLKMGGAPIFMRQFALSTIPDQNEAGDKFFNYSIVPAGFIQDRDLFLRLQKMHMEMRDRSVTVDYSDEADASQSSAAEAERQAF
jgi:hypothetical protein